MKTNDWNKKQNNAVVALYFKAPEGRNGKTENVARFSKVHGKSVDAITWKMGQVEAIVGTNKGADHVQKETIDTVQRYAKSHKRHDIHTRIKKYINSV